MEGRWHLELRIPAIDLLYWRLSSSSNFTHSSNLDIDK